MISSFAEQPRMQFYIGNIPKSVFEVLNSQAPGYYFSIHARKKDYDLSYVYDRHDEVVR